MTTSRLIKFAALAAGAGALGWVALKWRKTQDFQFENKVVLITGGSRGLGLILARKLGSAGARIAICARNTEQLERAEAELKARGIDVLAFCCDVTDQSAVASMITQISGHWGPIHVLINNAGVIQMGPLDSMTAADFDQAMKTHFWAPLNCMWAVIPAMRQRKSGRIVNIASIGGKIAIPHLTPYCASKFALVGLSEGAAQELAQQGIVLTTICPGLMRTGSHQNALFKGQHRREFTWFSIAGSLPGSSMSADAAANQIISTIARGDRLAVIGFTAQCLNLIHAVVPQIVGNILTAANHLLPSNGGIGNDSRRGADSHSPLASSVLTSLSERATVRNNELD
jgi:NAD(P)-dependent dehydrogenase (short-subunit alcohol dehydrogenase family)